MSDSSETIARAVVDRWADAWALGQTGRGALTAAIAAALDDSVVGVLAAIGRLTSCGDSPGVRASGLTPTRVGCGQPVMPAEVYRCTDCQVPFHRECLRRHFGERVRGGEGEGT
jgi:hypothetical protein